MLLKLLFIFAILTKRTLSNELSSLPYKTQELVWEVFGNFSDKQDNDITAKKPLTNVVNTQTSSPPLTLIDADGEPCSCVPYYFCDNKTVTEKEDFHIDIRFNPQGCTGHQEVCCKEKSISKISLIQTKVSNDLSICGLRNSNGIDFRIIGNTDNEAEFGEFPWTVAVIRASNDECLCVGSLIHPQIVLTAAHCVHRLNGDAKIRAGEWDTQTVQERLPFQENLVSDIVIHPSFNKKTLYNDIALLKLIEPVKLDEHIQTVCLPNSNYIATDKNCFATGWGKDKFGQIGNYQVIMKRVELPIVQHDTCEQLFQKSRLGPRFTLHPSFVCAGGEIGKDTCEGDGGAPLVCPVPSLDNRYHQIGIVAWGIGCGDALPAAYGNVPMFRSWIDEEVRKMGFDASYYTI